MATSNNHTATATRPTERELILTRVFDAPRALVYRAWTEREHMMQWWLPGPGFTVPVCELDVRPGGALRIDMRGPDGTLYPNTGCFFEVSKPDRLVFGTVAVDDVEHAIIAGMNTVTLAAQQGKTKLTLHARIIHVAPEAAAAIAGMEMGWSNCLDRLAERVALIGR
jgi:uncharacterized protein YndB with AHSA1/START domain